MLLDAGAPTEVKNRRGRLPLTHAIFENKEAIVQLQLCDSWPSFDSLLHFTMTVSSLAVLKLLLDHFEKVTKSTKGSFQNTFQLPRKPCEVPSDTANSPR